MTIEDKLCRYENKTTKERQGWIRLGQTHAIGVLLWKAVAVIHPQVASGHIDSRSDIAVRMDQTGEVRPP